MRELNLNPRVDANPETAALFAELREQALDMFDVAIELLPSEYCGKRKFRKLSGVEEQYNRQNPYVDPRSLSVKFGEDSNGNRVVTEGTQERIAMIEAYRLQAESIPSGGEDQESDYDFDPSFTHEGKLYANELAFCGAMIKAGMMEPFTDED